MNPAADTQQRVKFPWDTPGEAVVFETPEQTQVEYTLAPFGTRLMAAMLDTLVVFLVVFLLGIALAIGLGVAGFLANKPGTLMLVGALYAGWGFFLVLYHVWFEVRWEGQTWGKRVVGIRAVLTTGQGLTLTAALVRNLARLIDLIPLMWLIPTLSVGRRRMGDLLGGTYVVIDAARQDRVLQVSWPAPTYGELEEKQFYFGGELAARLHREDLNLIEYLMVRVTAQPPRRRAKLLRAVAKRYIDRLGLEEDRDRIEEFPRRFFEELALFLKSRFEGQAY